MKKLDKVKKHNKAWTFYEKNIKRPKRNPRI